MSDMTPLASAADLELEELRRRNDAFNRLAGLKVNVSHVYRSWIAPDADLRMFVGGAESPADMIIFLDGHRHPQTALIDEAGHVQVRTGWKGYGEL